MERTSRMQIWKDMGGNLTEKQAELAGTYDMPWSPSGKRKDVKPGGEKAVIDKTASAPITEDDILKHAFGSDNKPQDNEEETITDETMKKQPQPKVLKPTVDVTSAEPPKLVTEKTAQRYALPSQGKYPLDGYGQVKLASAYFDEWQMRMDPEMRREFCQNMVKRAHELAIEVSPLAECYGSDEYATAGQIKQAMDARRMVLHSAMNPLHELAGGNTDVKVLDKLAEIQPGMLPDSFAAALGEFDRATGLNFHYDGDIPDPFYSTFSKTAAKLESKTDPDDAIVVGNEYLTDRELVSFSKNSIDQVGKRFGDDFASEFIKDPKSIFNSLPRDQKLVMMRMAQSHHAQGNSASKS